MVLQAARQSSIRTRAVSEAPTAQSTSRLLVDLAVENLPLKFGAGLRAVGSTVELGSWNVDDAPAFQWSEGDNWHKQLELPAGEQEFKVRWLPEISVSRMACISMAQSLWTCTRQISGWLLCTLQV